ncbi:threonine ammonia-lyase, partial [Aduncisulcus paluster]
FSCDSSKQILSHVVVPRRHFSSCWSTVAGIALFFHCFRLKHSTDWPIVVPVEGENLPRESEGIYGISGDRLYQSSKVKRKKAIAAAKKALRKEEEEGEDEEGEDGNEEEEEEEESYSEDLSLSSPMLKRTLSILSHVPPSSFVSYDAPSRQWFLTRMQRASVGCVFEDFDTDESGDVTEKELCEVIFQLFDGGMTPLTETECSMICQTVPIRLVEIVNEIGDSVGTSGYYHNVTGSFTARPNTSTGVSPMQTTPLSTVSEFTRVTSASPSPSINPVKSRPTFTITPLSFRGAIVLEYAMLDSNALIHNKDVLSLVQCVSQGKRYHMHSLSLSCIHTHTCGPSATGLAAVLSGRIGHGLDKTKVVAVLVPGGPITMSELSDNLKMSMALSGVYAGLKIRCEIEALTAMLSRVTNLCKSLKITVQGVKTEKRHPVAGTDGVDATTHGRIQNTSMHLLGSLGKFRKLHTVLKSKGFDFDLTHPTQSGAQTLINPNALERALVSAKALRHSIHAGYAACQFDVSQNLPEAASAARKALVKSWKKESDRVIQDITMDTIKVARTRIDGLIRRMPMYKSSHYSRIVGADIFIGLDNLQRTGSFKQRGSANYIVRNMEAIELGVEKRPKGFVCCSAGNHGGGVARACKKLGMPCVIFTPSYAPDSKLEFMRRHGAEVRAVGDSFEESLKLAYKFCDEKGWKFVHPFDAISVMEGQGTIGLEISEAVPDVDVVLCAVGGGGLISGVSTFLKQYAAKRKGGKPVRVIGVQASKYSPLCHGFKETAELAFCPDHDLTLADGVAVTEPGGRHDSILYSLIDEFVEVEENLIAAAATHFLQHSRTVVEGAGALALAALMFGKVHVKPHDKVVCVMCGGNVPLSRILSIQEYGSRTLGKSLRFKVIAMSADNTLAQIINTASKCAVRLRRVTDNIGGETEWSQVEYTFDFWSESHETSARFLILLLKQGIIPILVGMHSVPDKELHECYDGFFSLMKERESERKDKKEKAFKLHVQNQRKKAKVIIHDAKLLHVKNTYTSTGKRRHSEKK